MMDLKNVPKSLRKKNGAPNGKKIYVKWTDETNKCFEKLKETLCCYFVLALPDFTKEMILTTDASDKGYGAVLEQEFVPRNKNKWYQIITTIRILFKKLYKCTKKLFHN